MATGTFARRGRSGFTLTELLVVIMILSVLAGITMLGLSKWGQRADEIAVETAMRTLEAALETYANRTENGDYPPSSLADYPGVGRLTNRQNLGMESVVLCLSRKGTATHDFESIKEMRLENFDDDRTERSVTTFGKQDLFELVDPWDMPIVYFHSRDYARVESLGLGSVTGFEDEIVQARPWKSAKTGSYFKARGFQLISAGPDATFNTEDDITNFERN